MGKCSPFFGVFGVLGGFLLQLHLLFRLLSRRFFFSSVLFYSAEAAAATEKEARWLSDGVRMQSSELSAVCRLHRRQMFTN